MARSIKIFRMGLWTRDEARSSRQAGRDSQVFSGAAAFPKTCLSGNLLPARVRISHS